MGLHVMQKAAKQCKALLRHFTNPRPFLGRPESMHIRVRPHRPRLSMIPTSFSLLSFSFLSSLSHFSGFPGSSAPGTGHCEGFCHIPALDNDAAGCDSFVPPPTWPAAALVAIEHQTRQAGASTYQI